MTKGRTEQCYHEQFEEDFPTIVWLPEGNRPGLQHIKQIKEIISKSPHNTITAIRTREIDDLEVYLPDRDILDESEAEWWYNPTPELATTQPATPHTRVATAPTNVEHGRPNTKVAKLYILTFSLPTEEGKGHGPEWLAPWYWMKTTRTPDH